MLVNEQNIINKYINPEAQANAGENKAKKNYYEFEGDEEIKSGDGLSDKQMLLLDSFDDYSKDGHYDFIDSSYVFIEFEQRYFFCFINKSNFYICF